MQRQTPQRRAILSAVSAAQSPLTAEQVHTEVCSAFPRLALTQFTAVWTPMWTQACAAQHL